MTRMGEVAEETFEQGQYPRAAPVMVWVTLLIFLAIMVLLGYRWLNMAEPNGFIIVHGTEAFAGAEINIEGTAGNTIESTARLTDANNYQMRFPLPQGIYRLTVRWQGKVILREPVELKEATGMVCTLDPKLLPATQPSDLE